MTAPVHGRGLFFDAGHRRLSAPRSGFCPQKTLPRSPYIKAGRLPQEKVFQDELPFARDKRLAADSACYFQIGGLGARLSFDNLVKRLAV
jgi:hypothetical protein